MIEKQSRSRERRFPSRAPTSGNLPARDPSGRPALLNQEGVALPHLCNLSRRDGNQRNSLRNRRAFLNKD